MIPNPMILGIESSCDETAAAVVEGGSRVLSNIVATQHELHSEYAGVVPEIASRAHIERLLPVIREALRTAGMTMADLDAIAVGHRPGLIGSLLVGISAAKALAWSLSLPLIGVDHIVAHLHACALDNEAIEFPSLGLVVSGGHTSLFRWTSPLEIELIGKTIDDAMGEAFDKAATILRAGYPGGPMIDRLAATAGANDRAHEFPVSQLGPDSLNFSFSGLKTALLYAVRGVPKRTDSGGHEFERNASDLSKQDAMDFAASFQRAAVRAVLKNVSRAIERSSTDFRSLVVGGGVSANSRLRAELDLVCRSHGLPLRLPAPTYCIDNAAMIAGYAHFRFCAGLSDGWDLAAATQSAIERERYSGCDSVESATD